MATEETKKVMDVAKPGTSTPDIGSKPMVIGHKSMASDPMVAQTKSVELPKEEAPQLTEATKVTITPPNNDLKADDNAENIEEKSKITEPVETETQPEESEKGKEQEVKEESQPDADKDKAAENKEEDDKKTPEAKKAEEDKAAADKALEQEEHLQKLIEEKKYFVPIKQAKNTSARTFLVSFVIVAIIGVIIVVALIDAGVLDLGIKLPFNIL